MCACDDEQAFRRMRLEGAIPLGELEPRLPSLPRDHEIVFRCG